MHQPSKPGVVNFTGTNNDQSSEDNLEADEAPEEDLDFDISAADEQELINAASAELKHPRTLAQNRALLAAAWLSDLIQEWMRFVQIPALLPTTCALVSISAVLMRGLRCWANKGWIYSNLYALLGATSGIGKTLVYNEAARPLLELDSQLLLETKELKANLRTELGIIESTIKVKISEHEKDLKKGVKLDEPDLAEFKSELAELHQAKQEIEEQLKRRRSLWTTDFTSEALGALLQDNDEQMSVHSDEGGVALFNIEGKYNDGGQTDDILLCSAFSGGTHKVDRISREPVILIHPRCSLLLLTQPDLPHRAFRNERFVIGGLLARAFAMDCKLKMQPELPEGHDPINEELTAKWNKEIKALYHKFRCAKEPYTVQVAREARIRARRHYNAIAFMVRHHRLSDIDNFVARWTEITWRVALVIHAICYGTECDKVVLSGETYDGAVAITKIFFLEQLKVLQALRADRIHNTHTPPSNTVSGKEKCTHHPPGTGTARLGKRHHRKLPKNLPGNLRVQKEEEPTRGAFHSVVPESFPTRGHPHLGSSSYDTVNTVDTVSIGVNFRNPKTRPSQPCFQFQNTPG